MKILKWISISLGTVLLLIILALGAILMKPSLLFNTQVLEVVSRQLKKSGTELTWQSAKLEARSHSLTRKSFAVDLKNFCFSHTSAEGCFDRLALAFEVKLGKPIQVLEAGPITLLGGDVLVKRSVEEDAKKDDSSSSLNQWLSLKELKLKPVKVELTRWRVETEEETLQGKFDFASAGEASEFGHWLGSLETSPSKSMESARARFDFKNSKKDASGNWTAQVQATAALPAKHSDGVKTSRTSAAIDLKLTQLQARRLNFDYQLKADLNQTPRRVKAQLDGSYRLNQVKAKLGATIKTGVASAPQVRIKNCEMTLKRLSQAAKLPGHFLLDCPVTADMVLPSIEEVPHLDLPRSTGGRITADLKTAYPPSATQPIEGKIGVLLDPILTPLFEGGGHAEAQVAGVVAEFPKNFQVETDLALTVAIPEFKKVVQTFKKTQWAVPAPINAMAGRIEGGIKGRGDLQGGKFPLYLFTRLDSKYQQLKVNATGELSLARGLLPPSLPVSPAQQAGVSGEPKSGESYHSNLELDVVLTDVKLALPRLSLEKPPKVVGDRRIQDKQKIQKKKEAAETADFKYTIRIRTPDGQPLHLLSNLAEAPVPIFIDTRLTELQPIAGTVRVGDFPLKLFKRDADLERFIVKFQGGQEPPVIDGVVRVSYTDYTIRILLFGTTGKPQVKMVSDPPLSEDQLVSVLIFGRPLEELDATQGESVGNTKAALADGAVGLASLYLLASTPIESLGYDPQSGEVSAKVRLGEGTSLNLGTSRTGNEHIGIRRRLTQHWTVTTDLANSGGASGPEQQSGLSAFLEWSSRY